MVAVKDELLLGVGEVRSDGVDVALPHVHRYGFDALQLGGSERVEVAVKTRLTALIGDVLDRGAVKV